MLSEVVVGRDTGENSSEDGRVIWVASNFKCNGRNTLITIAEKDAARVEVERRKDNIFSFIVSVVV